MMAATVTRYSPSPAFDDRTSLDNSLEDFEHNEHSPALSIPSQHSGFKSSDGSASDQEEVGSEEPWSPPAWRNTHSVGGWYRHQPYPLDQHKPHKSASASRSRGTSHESYESALDEEGEATTRPADIPLPRTSLSPVRERSASPVKKESATPDPFTDTKQDLLADSGEDGGVVEPENNNNNCLPQFVPHLTSNILITLQSFALPFAPKFNNAQNQ